MEKSFCGQMFREFSRVFPSMNGEKPELYSRIGFLHLESDNWDFNLRDRIFDAQARCLDSKQWASEC